MLEDDGVIRTVDMTLATVLTLNGYHPVMEFKKDRQVQWVIAYEDVDEYSVEIMSDYFAGGCRVEPRRFTRELRAVRQNMYQFLGIGDRQRGMPITPSRAE